MSARQRHSRITTDDGWTTISNSHSRKSKSQNGKKSSKKSNKKQSSNTDQNTIEGETENTKGTSSSTTTKTAPGYSALLAHKSDLDFHDKTEVTNAGGIDEKELVKVRTRVERQIEGFMASGCCAKVKEMVRREFGVMASSSSSPSSSSSAHTIEKDGDENGAKEEGGIRNVLILALGSLSETFKAAPGYQLAAALSIIEVLKESYEPSKEPVDIEDPEKKEEKKKEADEDPKPNEENTTPTNPSLTILSYDPVYTPIDISILSTYNITTVPSSSLPTPSTNQDQWDKNWYENAVVYMPHASVWLNHKYLMYKPKVWIGNGFDMYEDRAAEGSEVDVVLKEAEKVRREEGYVKLEWPEEDWGGGVVFNNLVVYVRRGRGTGVDEV
ncbi:hypothetical protein TWF718_008727 [Orbilia javanica]|uniref:SRR1-like domain-containing protein n=1 Tax=Orbilia javanica TaxID=47235 RepID=A0AAN8RB37_9PEZI